MVNKCKKAVLFDLDGTLWEVVDSTYKSINEVTQRYNLKKIELETVCGVFGFTRSETAKEFFPYLDIEKAEKLLDEASILNIKNLKENGGNVYPNLENILKEITNNYKIFIVSNSGHSEYIQAFLTTSNLEKYFTSYIAASEANISKAEAIRKIINDYDINNAVYVGDTIRDMEAAKMANVPFIQAKYGFGEDLKTKYSINSIDELLDVIAGIMN